MTDTITLSRRELYDEVWKVSVAGVAKKYGVTYSVLLKCCKDHKIPYPPSGYWTRLAFNKPVEQPPLPEAEQDEIILPLSGIGSMPSERKQELDIQEASVTVSTSNDHTDVAMVEAVLGKAKTQSIYGAKHNIYERETLYQEVWSMPVTKVALKYGVSDVALHKQCKALNIPVPSRGYWAKLQAGQQVEKDSIA